MPDDIYYTVEKTNKEHVYLIVEIIDSSSNKIRNRNIIEYGKLFELPKEVFRKLLQSLRESGLFTISEI